jgi:hypothetical protein
MLTAILFAATVAAEITTSIRLPSGPTGGDKYQYSASVVAVDGDKTTMAIAMAFDGEIEYSSAMTETITIGGSTWLESSYITSMKDDADYSYSVGCSLPANTRESLTCTYSENGAYLVSAYCETESIWGAPSTETYEYTYTTDEFGPASVETIVETYGGDVSNMPDICTSGASTFPESIAVQTVTLKGTYARYMDVVVTAGEEKLGASAGATPTSSGARSTGSATGTSSVSFTTSTASGSGSSTAPTDAPAAPESTNAAAPMITMAPALAGLGVAMAAFVL